MTFEAIRECLVKILGDHIGRLSETKGLDGLCGGSAEETNLVALAGADGEKLKRMRFQSEEKPSYDSMTSFLKSLGITSENIESISEDFITVPVSTVKSFGNTVCFLIDLKKIRETKWENLDNSSKTLIYCLDSSNAIGNPSEEDDNVANTSFGQITRNIRVVRNYFQEGGSCWYHAPIATLAAAGAPEIIRWIKYGDIETFEILKNEGTEYLTPEEFYSEFSGFADRIKSLPVLLQMNELLRIDKESGTNVAKMLLAEELVEEAKKYSVKKEMVSLFKNMIREEWNRERYRNVAEQYENIEKFIQEHRKEFSNEMSMYTEINVEKDESLEDGFRLDEFFADELEKDEFSLGRFIEGSDNLFEMGRLVSELRESLEKESKRLEDLRKATEKSLESPAEAIGKDLESLEKKATEENFRNSREATGENLENLRRNFENKTIFSLLKEINADTTVEGIPRSAPQALPSNSSVNQDTHQVGGFF
jgi:hypothetical protein